MEFKHISVLLNEVIESLNIKPDGIYVDGTVGGAGHSTEIAKRLVSGRLIALDRDPDAVKTATERLKGYNATVIQSNFADMKQALESINIYKVDGILLTQPLADILTFIISVPLHIMFFRELGENSTENAGIENSSADTQK